jgi:hypothetical protein
MNSFEVPPIYMDNSPSGKIMQLREILAHGKLSNQSETGLSDDRIDKSIALFEQGLQGYTHEQLRGIIIVLIDVMAQVDMTEIQKQSLYDALQTKLFPDYNLELDDQVT